MSAATKRKHVAKEIFSEFPPLPNPPQLFVARILAGRGNNLHLVEAVLDDSPSSSTLPQFLVSMPVKFRKNFWVKRGDFILCSPIEEGDKVKAEIVRVLYKDDVRYFREQGKWPKEFDESEDVSDTKTGHSDDDMFPASSSEDEEDEEEESNDENADRNGHGDLVEPNR